MNSQFRNYLGAWLLVLGFSMLIWISLISINATAPRSELLSVKKPVQTKEVTKIAEEIFTLGRFPDYIRGAPSATRQAYEFAADIDNHKTLEALHCHCGCEDGGYHKNLLDCYIKKLLPGNRVVYSEHALSCRTCVKQVLDTQKYLSEGKTIAEISDLIDDQYMKD